MRAGMREMVAVKGPGMKVAGVEDRAIPGPAGAIPSRVYDASSGGPARAGVAYFEEAERAFHDHGDPVRGIISDVEFPRVPGDPPLPRAGADFARLLSSCGERVRRSAFDEEAARMERLLNP